MVAAGGATLPGVEAGDARAEPPPATRRAPGANSPVLPVVPVVVAGGAARTAETTAMLEETLRRSLNELGLGISLRAVAAMDARDVLEQVRAPSTSSASTTATSIRVWIDLRVPRVAVLYITDGKNVFIRRFALRAGVDSVGLDLLDFVITGSLEAVLAGRPVGIPREEFSKTLAQRPTGNQDNAQAADQSNKQPQPGPVAQGGQRQPPRQDDAQHAPPSTAVAPLEGGAPPAPARSPSIQPTPSPTSAPTPPPVSGRAAPIAGRPITPIDWTAGAVYETALLSSHQVVHGLGVALQAERSRIRFGPTFQARLPYQTSGGGTTIRLTAAGIRIFAGRALTVSRALTLVAGAAVGADLNRVQTVSTANNLSPAGALWSLEPLVRPSLQLEVRRGRLIMGALLGLDLTLVESRYLIERASAAQPVWVPSRWRPLVGLCLTGVL